MFGKRSSFKDAGRGRITKSSKRSFRAANVKEDMLEDIDGPVLGGCATISDSHARQPNSSSRSATSSSLTSSIITIVVGQDQRLFAAHEDVLCHSPFFATVIRHQIFEQGDTRRISLPDEVAEVFSCILEYLYKGDYYPRLLHDKRRNTWMLEGTAGMTPDLKKGGRSDGVASSCEPTMHHSGVGGVLLRDTVVYCAAARYELEDLQRLALGKQGLQGGIEVGVILRSARYAYDNTPDSDSKLRAHYLALIIRSRKTFKRSGTMQTEMEMGGKLFFDLFVAMCNHLDDVAEM